MGSMSAARGVGRVEWWAALLAALACWSAWGDKLASKTWGRVILTIGRGYLAVKGDGRAESHAARFDGTRSLTPEERSRLDDAERRTVDHRPPGDATA